MTHPEFTEHPDFNAEEIELDWTDEEFEEFYGEETTEEEA